MCIALITTAHPDYAVIILNNRDEFLRRPTSRPHWWRAPHAPATDILSARDLARKEQGTWLGVTKSGKIAILTNYREKDTHDASHPIEGLKSRGALVTAWLTSPATEETEHFVSNLLQGEGVKGVGGFSLVCGRLRKQPGDKKELEPMAIISNRSARPDDVPWIAGQRGEVYGLSNTYYSDPNSWPKVDMGKEFLLKTIEDAVANGLGEDELVQKFWDILNHDTLPRPNGEPWDEFIMQLKKSIFVPCLGEDPVMVPNGTSQELAASAEPSPAPHQYTTGKYGTQRQTIILVDWDGNVTLRERTLFGDDAETVEKGEGEVKFQFKAQEWHDGELSELELLPESLCDIEGTTVNGS